MADRIIDAPKGRIQCCDVRYEKCYEPNCDVTLFWQDLNDSEGHEYECFLPDKCQCLMESCGFYCTEHRIGKSCYCNK